MYQISSKKLFIQKVLGMRTKSSPWSLSNTDSRLLCFDMCLFIKPDDLLNNEISKSSQKGHRSSAFKCTLLQSFPSWAVDRLLHSLSFLGFLNFTVYLFSISEIIQISKVYSKKIHSQQKAMEKRIWEK